MTNYAVVRLQRDIGRRAGSGDAGDDGQSANHTPVVNATLPDNAYVAGADGYLFLDADRDWAMNFAASGSRVDGSPSAITRLQYAPQRYYQRPDAPHLRLDPNATSLSRFSGRVSVNRNSGLVQLNAMLWGVSPGFESNDLGFHSNGDRAGTHAVVIWRNVTPGQVLRDRMIWVAKSVRGISHASCRATSGAQTRVTFLNYWNAGAAIFANRHSPDDRLTRGGPMAMSPRGFDLNGWANTDGQALSLNINAGMRDDAAGGWGRSLGVVQHQAFRSIDAFDRSRLEPVLRLRAVRAIG